MDRILSSKIEAVLLYDEFAILGSGIWEKLINEFSTKNGITFKATENVKTPDFFHFLSDDMTIEVDYVSEPVVAEAFENSLSSKFTKEVFPDAKDAVSKHGSYVHIVITNGQIDPPDPFIDEEPQVPLAFEAEGFDFAVELLRWLSTVQISSSEPVGVYWAQCDKLLPPREFLKLAIDFKNPSLLVHPMYTFHQNLDTGEAEHGLHTWGARCLIGAEIKMEPVALPRQELLAFVDHLIGITAVTGMMVPDNHVFGRSDDEEIRVNLTEDENGELLIELMIERCDAFGISPTSENSDELEQFDLDDPTERAMYERIKLQREAEKQSVSPYKEVSDFQNELQETNGWDGVKKKVDMASLRSLTRGSSADEHSDSNDDILHADSSVNEQFQPTEDAESETAPQQRRLFKKVGGLFQRK